MFWIVLEEREPHFIAELHKTNLHILELIKCNFGRTNAHLLVK